jgi:hypothetical protein
MENKNRNNNGIKQYNQKAKLFCPKFYCRSAPSVLRGIIANYGAGYRPQIIKRLWDAPLAQSIGNYVQGGLHPPRLRWAKTGHG